MAEHWTIDYQRQVQVLLPRGGFGTVWEIGFTTNAGTHAKVTVDERNYNPDYIRGAIDDYVSKIRDVESL